MTEKEEYGYVFRLEKQLNKTRWSAFLTLTAVSAFVTAMLLMGLSTLDTTLRIWGMVFAWFIFIVGFIHYLWFHWKVHEIRERLIELEDKLNIQVFKKRGPRPIPWMRFHWFIILLAIIYTVLMVLVVTYKGAS